MGSLSITRTVTESMLASWLLSAILTLAPTIDFSSSWVSLDPASHSYITLPLRHAPSLFSWFSWFILGLLSLSLLLFYLPLLFPPTSSSHGLIQSTGHIYLTTFSPSSGLFHIPLVVLSLQSTTKAWTMFWSSHVIVSSEVTVSCTSSCLCANTGPDFAKAKK